MNNSLEIIKKAWSFYKHNFKRLWPIFLFGSAGGFGIYSLVPDTSKISSYIYAFNTPFIVIIVSLCVALSIFLFISHITLYKTISNTFKGHIQNYEDSYKVGQELFISALLVAVIYDLSVQGASQILIIPGIILSVYLVFYLFEFVDQNKRGMDALLSSWAIVSGRWWEVFWRVIIVSLMIVLPFLIIVSAFILPIFSLSFIFGMNSMLAFLLSVFIVIFVFITILLIVPLTIISLFEVYYYFRNSRDNKRNEKTDKRRALIIEIFAIIGLMYLIFEILNRFHINIL